LLSNLPKDEEYEQYKLYPNRTIYRIKEGFWSEVLQGFQSLFGRQIRVQLCRDYPGYSIGPHTDGGRDKETYLFYLAKDDSKPHLGTSIYTREGFTCDGSKHHPREGFELVTTAPYLPNTGFHFFRTNNSFHGVEPTDSVRDVLQVNIY
jgi:hypothetical protein